MESKYYTPTIEEFHVGFEYELKVLDEDWIKLYTSKDDSFKSYITDNGFTNVMGICDILTGPQTQTRVKYLDKEDIESCGFELVKDLSTGYNEWMFFRKPVPVDYEVSDAYYELSFSFSGVYKNYIPIGEIVTIRIKYVDPSELDPCLRNSNKMFSGQIKNLSELKVLLKQLGIDG